MMDLEPILQNLDSKSDSFAPAAKSPAGRNRLVTVLIAAAIIAGLVVFSTTAINSSTDDASLNVEISAVDATVNSRGGDHPTIITADLAVTGLLNKASWWVQVFSMRDRTNTLTAWSSLQKTNQDLLDGLEMHVQLAELSSGTFYRVQAGPLADRASAASLCDTLKTRRQDCLVVDP